MGDLRDPAYAEALWQSAPDEYLRRREFLQRAALTAGLASGLATVLDPGTLVAEAARRQARVPLPRPRNLPIDHFVVIMMENRSFDHYLGWMPEADGRQEGLSYIGREGERIETRRFAPDFQGCGHPDPTHSWSGNREAFAGGAMDGFARAGSNDEFALSYYLKEDVPFIPHAAEAYTAYDRFFCSVLGPTFPNREYMHAATSYGKKDNSFPDPPGFPDTTIFRSMLDRGLTARYFFNDAPASGLWGMPGLARSSRVEEYYAACEAGTLPNLSFVDPSFGGIVGPALGVSGDEHPHGDIRTGQAFMADVVNAFVESPNFERGALFILYDEHGGFFDHVRPPRVPDDLGSRDLEEDFGQMGPRIPAVGVSPYLRNGHVDHGKYGFESVLKMIEYRFGLAPLTTRDRYARNIARSFDWERKPRLDPPPLPDPPDVISQPCANQGGGEVASARPKQHDMMNLVTSGYLERLGFEYRPATMESMFRRPSAVGAARMEAR